MSKPWSFQSADFCPIKDQALLERLAKMTPEEIEHHDNPDVNIRILPNAISVVLAEKFLGIKQSYEENKLFSTIFGNPNPQTHMALAELINRNRISCKNCVFVTMDEWADENGNVAPDTYRSGFTYSKKKYIKDRIDP